MSEEIGFIGVGAMGSALAGCLVDTYSLHVYDLNRAAAQDLVERGATFSSPRDMARSCKIVVLCLPAPAHVKDLLFGEGDLANHLPAGSIVVDATTGTPTDDAEILASLNERGIHFADAPVSGGVRGVRAGKGTLMVGASPETFAQIDKLLHTITPNVFHVGGVGTGHTMKLLNNMLNNCNRFAALEAVRLGQLGGMSTDTVIEVLNKSSGRNHCTEFTYTQLRDGDTWQPQDFTIELMRKDIRQATKLAKDLGLDAPIGNMVAGFVEVAADRFGPDADQSVIMSDWYK